MCNQGYDGNGYDCHIQSTQTVSNPNYAQATCSGECSENAFCKEGVCICRAGFIGNGYDCRMICALNEVFNGISCVKTASIEEGSNFITFYIVEIVTLVHIFFFR